MAIDSGYTESKWVAERVLAVAAEKNVVLPTIVRIGQLAGGPDGAWNTAEWIPSLVAASCALGYLPDGSGVSSKFIITTNNLNATLYRSFRGFQSTLLRLLWSI